MLPTLIIRRGLFVSPLSIHVVHQLDQINLGSHPLVHSMLSLKAGFTPTQETLKSSSSPSSSSSSSPPSFPASSSQFAKSSASRPLSIKKILAAKAPVGWEEKASPTNQSANNDSISTWLNPSIVATLGAQTLAILRFYEENHRQVNAETIVGVLNALSLSIVRPEMRKMKQKLPEERSAELERAIRNSLDATKARERKEALRDNHVFQEILTQVAHLARQLNPRDLATLCRILNSLELRDDPVLLDRVFGAVVNSLPLFNSLDTIITLQSLTSLMGNRLPRSLLLPLVSQICTTLPERGPRDLSIFAWSLSKQGLSEAELATHFSAILARAEVIFPKFKPQEIATILYALANAGVRGQSLFDKFEQRAEKLSDMSPQGLANIAWAFAKLDHRGKVYFRALDAEIVSRPESFIPQQLSILVWAHGKLSIKPPEATAKILQREILRQAHHLTPQGLANTSWGFARLNLFSPELQQGISVCALRSMSRFKAQELSNLIWAFAKATPSSDTKISLPLAAPLLQASMGKLREFNPQNISNLVWSLASLGIFDSAAFDAVAAVITRDIGRFSETDLKLLNWAYHKYSEQPSAGPKTSQDLLEMVSRRLLEIATVKDSPIKA